MFFLQNKRDSLPIFRFLEAFFLRKRLENLYHILCHMFLFVSPKTYIFYIFCICRAVIAKNVLLRKISSLICNFWLKMRYVQEDKLSRLSFFCFVSFCLRFEVRQRFSARQWSSIRRYHVSIINPARGLFFVTRAENQNSVYLGIEVHLNDLQKVKELKTFKNQKKVALFKRRYFCSKKIVCSAGQRFSGDV